MNQPPVDIEGLILREDVRFLRHQAFAASKTTHARAQEIGQRLGEIADRFEALQARVDELEGVREQGQAEGFAAAVAQLRDMSGTKPKSPLWFEANSLADSLEQSRIPGSSALTQPRTSHDEEAR